MTHPMTSQPMPAGSGGAAHRHPPHDSAVHGRHGAAGGAGGCKVALWCLSVMEKASKGVHRAVLSGGMNHESLIMGRHRDGGEGQ